jgi:putative phosphoesterase
VRAVVLSDTHLRAGAAHRLPDVVYEALASADVVFHCGDVVERTLLDDLAAYARVYAVLGNNDVTLRGALPERLVVELEGVRVGMVHDSGPTKGRAARMRRTFPTCELVIFGHSHAPIDEPGVDGQWLLNPGSPTQRRRQPHPSFATIDLQGGRIADHRIVAVV